MSMNIFITVLLWGLGLGLAIVIFWIFLRIILGVSESKESLQHSQIQQL